MNPYFQVAIQLPIFLLACFVLFTLTGIGILKLARIKLNFAETAILATTIGYITFTLATYILLLLHIEMLSIPIFILVNLFQVKSLKLPSLQNLSSIKKQKRVTLATVFALGIIGQLLIIAPSGFKYNGDLVFWSAHGHDGLWHIALIEEIKKGFPLQNPTLVGEKLVNYHFFSDLASANFSSFFHFSSLDLYFRFFPLLYSILLGSSAFILGKKIGGNFQSGIWTTIFVYFSGSFGYILSFIRDKNLGGEAMFWSTQIQSSIGNPPQIVSNIIILTFLYLFIIWLQKPTLRTSLICILLILVLPVFKVYAAIILFLSLGVVGTICLIFKKDLKILGLGVAGSILGSLLYLPNTKSSASFLIWEPWWFIRTMVVATDKLDWLDLELRRQTYVAEHNWKRVISLEALGGFIFLFGNLGTKFIGLFYLFKTAKLLLKDSFHQLLFVIMISSLLLPLLFLQKGVAGNTIQFLQYFLLVFCLYSGLTTAIIINKIRNLTLKIVLIILLIILSIPTQLGLILNTHLRPPYAIISSAEIDSLNYLKSLKQQDVVILTPPYDRYFKTNYPVQPIWNWSDTAYLSALSTKSTYLTDVEQVDILGYDYKERLQTQKSIFEETNPTVFEKLIRDASIYALYFPNLQSPQVDLSKTMLEKVYSNVEVQIWLVNYSKLLQ